MIVKCLKVWLSLDVIVQMSEGLVVLGCDIQRSEGLVVLGCDSQVSEVLVVLGCDSPNVRRSGCLRM